MKRVVLSFVLCMGIFPMLRADTLNLRIASLGAKYGQEETGDSLLSAKTYFLYDSLIRKAFREEDTAALPVLYLRKADLEYGKNMYTAAYSLYDSAFRIMTQRPADEREGLPEIFLRQAEIAYYLGKYAAGVAYIYDLLRLDTSLSPVLRIQAYIRLGNLFIRLGKNNLALENLESAQRLRKSVSCPDSVSERLDFDMNIAFSSAYIQKGDYEASLEYILKARRTESIGDLTKVYQNLSIHYLGVQDKKNAEEYCRKALETAVKVYDRAVIMNNLAFMLCEWQRYEEALAICGENLKETAKTDVLHVRSNLYYIFSRIYEGIGDYVRALEYRKREQAVLDSVFSQESEERIVQLTNDFETEQIRRDKEILEYELKVAELKNFRKNTLIIVLVVVSCIVLFSVFKIIQKVRELMYRDENNRKAMQSSREEYETVLTSKTRELTSNTMYIARMCDTANRILKEAEKLEPYCQKKESRVLLDEIRRQIASLTIEERGWNDFKLYFEQIHPSFFLRLHETYPNLTAGENRLCAFIVMNLTTKEISALTNRSVRTVETAKFRLRKKMDIPKETSILSFLWQFTSDTAEMRK